MKKSQNRGVPAMGIQSQKSTAYWTSNGQMSTIDSQGNLFLCTQNSRQVTSINSSSLPTPTFPFQPSNKLPPPCEPFLSCHHPPPLSFWSPHPFPHLFIIYFFLPKPEKGRIKGLNWILARGKTSLRPWAELILGQGPNPIWARGLISFGPGA